MIALAVGVLLVVPFLSHVGTTITASRIYGQSMTEQYSGDAGIEWALWKLQGNPILTTNTAYGAAPLEPTPAEINDSPFPTTEIRFIEGAGATEMVTLDWQTGPGVAKFYSFVATDRGTVYVEVECEAFGVEIRLRPGTGPPETFFSPESFSFTEEIDEGGSYRVRVRTLDEEGEGIPYYGPGTITITYPIATYDIRSQKDDWTITATVTASYTAIRVISWQIE